MSGAGREARALVAAAAVGAQVGAAIAASRAVVHEVGPVSLAFLRYAIALVTLLPFVLAGADGWRALRLPRRDALLAAALGVLQFGALIALLNEGLRHIDAGLGALLFATFPLLTLALATALGRERFDVRTAAAIGLSIAGVALALGVRPPSDFGAEFALGSALVLGAAACGAVCAVLYRPLLERHAMLPLGTLAMAAAVATLAVAALGEGLPLRLPTLSSRAWAGIVFAGLSSGIGYWLWLWALKHTSATKATLFLALSPVTAAAIGLVALGEPLRWGFVAGTAAVLAALGLAARRR